MTEQAPTDILRSIRNLDQRLRTMERSAVGGGGVAVDGTLENGDLIEWDSTAGAWKPKNQMEVEVFGDL